MVKFGCTSLGSYPDAINSIGINNLDTYEVCGERGRYPSTYININGIPVSIHGPFYVSLTNPDKLESNINYICGMANAATAIGADRILVHSSLSRSTNRVKDLDTVISQLNIILDKLNSINFKGKLMIENPGRASYIGGKLPELIKIIEEVDGIIPCIDIGHLCSASVGAVRGRKLYDTVFNIIAKYFGDAFLLNDIHFHFSQQAYNDNGELKHMNLNEGYLPEYEPFIDSLVELGPNCNNRVICESRTNLISDALTLKEYYYNKIR